MESAQNFSVLSVTPTFWLNVREPELLMKLTQGEEARIARQQRLTVTGTPALIDDVR